jgi:pimeloyl-ACP methyl ester carboxylesterase
MTASPLSRGVAVRALVCALLCASTARADGRAPVSTPCVDRLAAEAGAPPPIAELRYRCIALSDERHVWVGVAGRNDADTVLLVHGLGNNAHRDWRAAVPMLARRFRVIALDLPGFGASQSLSGGYSFPALASALLEVLDLHQAQRVHVVGHSLGAALSLYFAHAYPERVDRLVLVDAAGILHKAVFVRHITALVELPKIGFAPLDRLASALDRRIEGLSRMVFRRVDNGFDLSAWLVENPTVRNALLGRYTQVDAAIGLVEHNFATAIRAVTAPTTVIWGRDDPIAPVRTGELLAARMQDARLHVFDGVGHVPMSESAERFNSVLETALMQPPAPKFNSAPTVGSHDNVDCANRTGAVFTGTFATLRLENCLDARIEFARVGRLEMEASSATLRFVSIESSGAALIARRSRVMATASVVRGAPAVDADETELDFAGVAVRADERGFDLRGGSRVYFSVSDVVAPEYSGDAHFMVSESSPFPAPSAPP